MKRSLKKAAEILARGRTQAFISRVAWLDLERLIVSAFNEITEYQQESAELGKLYLTKNRDYPPFDNPYMNAFNIMNQIQIHSGKRYLNVWQLISNSDKIYAERVMEDGAALWFSQDVTGSVIVFIAPYKSQAMNMNEDNIIIARYKCASSVSAKHIRQHFSTYFRYCSVTSAHGDLGLGGYIFRLRLRYGDFRYSNQMRSSLFRFFEPLLTAAGIIATLYAGNKLF